MKNVATQQVSGFGYLTRVIRWCYQLQKGSAMKCAICNEAVESGYDEFGRCRTCRKAEIDGTYNRTTEMYEGKRLSGGQSWSNARTNLMKSLGRY